MLKKYTLRNGYNVKDLLHFAFAHIEAADILFKHDPVYYDTAGYLYHLGVEVIFKAWHLHVFGFFKPGHNIQQLYNELKELDTSASLHPSHEEILSTLSKFSELRYPEISKPIEIGANNAEKIDELVEALWKILPDELIKAYNEIVRTRKGGRTLMVRNNDKPKK
ncbi:unnamed protein product [marine sediment metagenome]|uniref:HEPN domain-containing protein n=1 Tax=marine sediment metagenome TaxID=412755 RepID=X0X564_9ZZZZ